MSKPDPKKSPSAGGGAAASKSSAPATSGAAPAAGTNNAPPESDTPNPETAAAAPGAVSPLDPAMREKAAALFEGVEPDTVWGYREHPDHHAVVVMDGITTVKYTAAK